MTRLTKQKRSVFTLIFFIHLAERQGFEPWIRHKRMPDFESGAFDHSAIFPFSTTAFLKRPTFPLLIQAANYSKTAFYFLVEISHANQGFN